MQTLMEPLDLAPLNEKFKKCQPPEDHAQFPEFLLNPSNPPLAVINTVIHWRFKRSDVSRSYPRPRKREKRTGYTLKETSPYRQLEG